MLWSLNENMSSNNYGLRSCWCLRMRNILFSIHVSMTIADIFWYHDRFSLFSPIVFFNNLTFLYRFYWCLYKLWQQFCLIIGSKYIAYTKRIDKEKENRILYTRNFPLSMTMVLFTKNPFWIYACKTCLILTTVITLS